MPRFWIKPLAKLTKEQVKVIFKRVFEEKGAKLTPEIAGKVLGGIEPAVKEDIGTLIKRRALGGGEFEEAVERLPIAEARAKYFANPEQYVTPRAPGPQQRF